MPTALRKGVANVDGRSISQGGVLADPGRDSDNRRSL